MKRKVLIIALIVSLVLSVLATAFAAGDYFVTRQRGLNNCLNKAEQDYHTRFQKGSTVEDGETVNRSDRALAYALYYHNDMTRCQIMWGNSWIGERELIVTEKVK